MLGASLNEIGLVALLVALVLLAARVSAIGEAIGGFFARSGEQEGRGSTEPAGAPARADHGDDGKQAGGHGGS